jgi:hypothetical protein
VAGGVSVLAGEEECVLNRLREKVGSVEASGSDVTVCAE